MWPTIKTEKPFEVPFYSEQENRLVMLVTGFTLGFGYFVVLHAVRLTRRVNRFSMFIVLIWLELSGTIMYGVPAALFANGVIPHSFWLYFFIVLGWVFQLQCLIQIIVNRTCILLNDPKGRALKWSMFLWIGAINVAVGCIWIPAQLQVSSTYIRINLYFDRCEKFLYLFTDAALNYYFIHLIKSRLIANGLRRFDKLVKFNMMIIWASLSMDILIIAMMFLSNHFLYTIFHPLAYVVKLEIEMTMSNLIVAVARGTGLFIDEFCSTTQSRPSQLVQVLVHTETVVDEAYTTQRPGGAKSPSIDQHVDMIRMPSIMMRRDTEDETSEDTKSGIQESV